MEENKQIHKDEVPRLTANDLIRADRDVPVPFRIEWEEGGQLSSLEFRSILRLLPGRRLVGLAYLNDEPLLVKLFLGKTAERYASRERTGAAAIASSGVSTPSLKWDVSLPGAELIAFEYLLDAVPLSVLTLLEGEASRSWLKRVAEVLAQLHRHGVTQEDIHLDNFLLHGEDLYTIDGGAVRRKSDRPLPEVESLRNLAEFLAQLFPIFDSHAAGVLSHYQQTRGWIEDDSRLGRLIAELQRCRNTRQRSYIGKAFRDCTRFVCESSLEEFRVCDRSRYSHEMQLMLDDIDSAVTTGKRLKDGNTATVALIDVDGQAFVVKRYNIKNKRHGIRRALRKTRAWRSWENALRLEFLGIPTVRPVALLEHRLGPFRFKGYFVTEYIEGPDASSLARSGQDDIEAGLGQVSDILNGLAEARISHGDLKANNFLMGSEGPVIIDLDSMRQHRSESAFARAFRRDLRRLRSNWQDDPVVSTVLEERLKDLMSRYGANVPAAQVKCEPL